MNEMFEEEFHAFIDYKSNRRYGLVQHSIDTLLVALYTSINPRLRTISNKLTLSEEAREIIHSYFLLSFLLHDIGKIMLLYQKRPRGWNQGYFLHEIISGLIMHKFIEKMLIDDIDNVDYTIIKYLTVEAVTRHHYAITGRLTARNLSLLFSNNKLRGYLVVRRDDLMKYMLNIKVCLADLRLSIQKLLDLISNILHEILPNLEEKIFINRSTIDNFIKSERKLQVDIENRSYNDIWIYLSTIVGFLSLADYTAGSLERSDLKGYVSRIFSIYEIEILRHIIPVKCGSK